MRTVIVGGGAAGCFCAIELKRRCPQADIIVIEKGTKALAKVAITGGGRCNLTNSFRQIRSIKEAYPRGEKLMKRALRMFSNEDVMQWFENEGVRLVTQEDECVFPQSQNAMEIVNTLLRLMHHLGVKLNLSEKVISIKKADTFIVKTDREEIHADNVVVTTGGSPKPSGIDFLSSLSLDIQQPVPSLFSFNINDEALHSLMGTVVQLVSARISGTKFSAEGPLLITHWGMSGPAILKLSSYAARHLAEKDYQSEISINWFCDANKNMVLEQLQSLSRNNQQKLLQNVYPKQFVQRHWCYLLGKSGLPLNKRWQELGPKQIVRLASLLTHDVYRMEGRGQFKDEFVTCGGVSLSNLDINTLECRQHPNLYFAGEVTDVDAITGGFNLQAAWTMGYLAAHAIAEKQKNL